MSILQFLEIPLQNFKTSPIGNNSKLNSSKSTVFRAPFYEKKLCAKHLNLKFRLDGKVGWHISCANILRFSSINRTYDSLINLPRLAIEEPKVASSPTTFMQWYFAIMKILKRTTCVLFDSTMRWCCRCLMILPKPRMKNWTL
jgi:hypothetical protein